MHTLYGKVVKVVEGGKVNVLSEEEKVGERKGNRCAVRGKK